MVVGVTEALTSLFREKSKDAVLFDLEALLLKEVPTFALYILRETVLQLSFSVLGIDGGEERLG